MLILVLLFFVLSLAENVRALDEGDGRLADKVGAVRDSDGLGALHLAAAREKLPVCHYLVEELRVDVDAVDNKGACVPHVKSAYFVWIAEYQFKFAFSGRFDLAAFGCSLKLVAKKNVSGSLVYCVLN